MLHLLLIISLPRWYLSPSLLLHALFSCIRCIRLPHSLNMLCCFLRLPAVFMHFDYSCLSTIHAARLYPVLNLINCCLASIRTCSSFSMLYGHIRRQTLHLLAYAWMSTYCFCAWICLNVMSNYGCLQKHWAHRILKYIICLINTVSSWIFLLVHLHHLSLLSVECSVLISSR